jgi:DNA-binding CsgD family transcriptional regulator
MQRRDDDFCEAVARAMNAAGTSAFHECVLQIARSVLAHDTCLTMRLTKHGAPSTLIVDGLSEAVMKAYECQFYRDDPIHTHWTAGMISGVHSLKKIDTAEFKKTSYYRDFLDALAHISDEIGVILPLTDQTAVGIWLQRSKGGFREADVKRMQKIFPLLQSLNNIHKKNIISSLQKTAEAETGFSSLVFKAVDDTGATVFASPAWRENAERVSDLDETATSLRRNNRASVMFDNGAVMQRIAAVSHDLLGQNGAIFVVRNPDAETSQLKPGNNFEWEQLTQREAEIVRLMLSGYPNALIAQKLCLSIGTVKNYRSRLYYKLDVTTERELILLLKQAMRDAGQNLT